MWTNTSQHIMTTPPKTNMDIQNDGLENVSPFKHGYFGIYVRFQGGCIVLTNTLEKAPP